MKPRKASREASNKKYRFETFEVRIAKIGINPLRKRRYDTRTQDDLQEYESHFTKALDRWKGINLSATFRAFSAEISPLCQSLAQLLHHAGLVFKMLIQHIKKADVFSIESLIDLLRNFALDLNQRFEPFLLEAVSVLGALASRHSQVEVIEWSFECLSWLFKYMSRVLLQHLDSIYLKMAPLLGREAQKAYVMRFAGEALAFLVKKAAASHVKDPKPIEKLILAISKDLHDTGSEHTQTDACLRYKKGIQSLFIQSMQGGQGKLHHYGIRLYSCILDSISSDSPQISRDLKTILSGVTLALVRCPDTQGLRTFVSQITSQARNDCSLGDCIKIETMAQLLSIFCNVQGVQQIFEWVDMIELSLDVLDKTAILDESDRLPTLSLIAAILHNSPWPDAFRASRRAMEILVRGNYREYFLGFCIYFRTLDQERFNQLVIPHFLEFLYANASEQKFELLSSITKLTDAKGSGKPICPPSWQRRLLELLQNLSRGEDDVLECYGLLRSLQYLSIEKSFGLEIYPHMQGLVENCLRTPNHIVPKLILGHLLTILTREWPDFGTQAAKLWPLLSQKVASYRGLMSFLESINLLAQHRTDEMANSDTHLLVLSIMKNLHSPSSRLRNISLELLQTFHSRNGPATQEALSLMLSIENCDLSLQSARLIPMQARRLATIFRSLSDTTIKQAITHFAFGMLTYKLSQVRDEAVSTLKSLYGDVEGEEVIVELVFDFLNDSQNGASSESISEPVLHDGRKTSHDVSFFSASTAEEEKISSFVVNAASATSELKEHYDQTTKHEDLRSKDASSLALFVLTGNIELAEKYSARITPHLLSWATVEEDPDLHEVYGMETLNSSTTDSSQQNHRWPMKSRQRLLSLFTHFQKPWKMAQSRDVLDAFEYLLAHGDVEVQKLALQAIFRWKQPEILPYQTHFTKLLDNALMRDEMATYWSLDAENSGVQTADRAYCMPVLLRLLYGRLVSKATHGRGKGEQENRRRTIVQLLASFEDTDIAEFISIALPNQTSINPPETGCSNVGNISDLSSIRRLSGALNVVKALLETMGNRLEYSASRVVEAILLCSKYASIDPDQSQLQTNFRLSSVKSMRQKCLKCLQLVAEKLSPEVLNPYMTRIYSEIVGPRLVNLSVETAQAISTTLRLFAAWMRSTKTLPFLVDYQPNVLASISCCLEETSSIDAVRLFVIEEIFLPLFTTLEAARTREENKKDSSKALEERVLSACSEPLFRSLSHVLKHTSNKNILQSGIQLVDTAAGVIGHTTQAHALVHTSITLLNQPAAKVGHQAKDGLLRILKNYLPATKPTLEPNTVNLLYNTLSRLFGYFRDRHGRLNLLEAFQAFAVDEVDLQRVVVICQGLNSFSSRKIEEPDFDERLRAFSSIKDEAFPKFSFRQWRPLIYNFLYFIEDTEEIAIRNQAAASLRWFIDQSPSIANDSMVDIHEHFREILLPSLRKGVSEESEIVRVEYLGVMAHLITHSPQWHEVNDLVPLLADGDDEASFFSNVLHIQQHRRLRALRRLRERASTVGFQSVNTAHYLIPLLEHFVFVDHEDGASHNLSAECVNTIGALTLSLEWPQFRATFKKYSDHMKSKPEHLKRLIKLLGVMTDTLRNVATTLTTHSKSQNPEHTSVLSKSLPGEMKLAKDVCTVLVPPLTAYVHGKEESTVSLRVPVSISVVKLLTILPPDEIDQYLAPVLTDICNILRSQAQESRDSTRKTLAQISVLLGPRYFSFIMKELRTALSRGSQLHVLSFTMHSILSETSRLYEVGDLDGALPQIVAVMVEDVFGRTGLEKEAEEYKSKMREVKSCKSYSTMELVATKVTISKLVDLITPLQAILEKNMDLRTMNKSEELLKRVSAGLLQNEALADQRFLVLCHEIIHTTYTGSDVQKTVRGNGYSAEIETATQPDEHSRNCVPKDLSVYQKVLIRFVLNLMRGVLQKHEILMTPPNLHGFLPVIGDAVVHADDDIKTSAMRLLTSVVRVPLKALERNAGIYVAECVNLVKNAPTTSTENAQIAYKLVSVILSHKPGVQVRESDLAFLLKRLIGDLENPDKQSMAFSFLKALLTRRVTIPEVYEAMDKVAGIMVTNHTKTIRDLARGAYFKFIMDFPQDKSRFVKQVGFLISNLDYKHSEGRQSVMEALHLLFTKVGEDLLQNIIGKCWIPLVMRLVNDDTSQCREMASALLRSSFERAGTSTKNSILKTLHIWLDQSLEPLLQMAAFQMYGLYLESPSSETSKVIETLQPKVMDTLHPNVRSPNPMNGESVYFALQTLAQICKMSPSQAFHASSAPLWDAVRACLAFPHTWVRLSAAKLLGTLYADLVRAGSEAGMTLPLIGSGGIRLTEAGICDDANHFIKTIETGADQGQDIVDHSTQNLTFLIKVMNHCRIRWLAMSSGTKMASEIEDVLSNESDEDSGVSREALPIAVDVVLSRLSYMLRHPPTSKQSESLLPRISALQLLRKMVKMMDASELRSRLSKFLTPLYHLTDSSIAAPSGVDSVFNERIKDISVDANELMSTIQEKVGTTDFVAVLHRARERVKSKRDNRREKRAIERVVNPERAGRQKRIKFERKKQKRKDKGAEYRAMRRNR